MKIVARLILGVLLLGSAITASADGGTRPGCFPFEPCPKPHIVAAP